jgi:hypothetical protein
MRVAGESRVWDTGRTVVARENRWLNLAIVAVLVMAASVVFGIRRQPPRDLVEEELAEIEAMEGSTREVPLDPYLGSETVVRGTVVDEAGVPVGGAKVDLTRPYREPSQAVRTGLDGSFTLSSLAPLATSDLVRAEDGDRLGLAVYNHRSSSRNEPVRVVLKPIRPLVVRVADTAGSPVAGAAVEVLCRYRGAVDPGKTDTGGVARFRLPADAEVRWVVALKDGVGLDYYENFRSFPPTDSGPLPAEVQLALAGGRTASVRATSFGGRPVPDLEFRPLQLRLPGKVSDVNLSSSAIAVATTDEAGIARVSWLPKTASAILYANPWEYELPRAATIKAGQDVVLNVRVTRQSRLSGRVVNPDGSPARGVLVEASGSGMGRFSLCLARTDERGDYTLSVAANMSYLISPVDTHRAATPRTGVVVSEGRHREDLDFRLAAGTRLRGRVATGPDRKPYGTAAVQIVVRGAVVPENLQSEPAGKQRERLVSWIWPDADGRYETRLGAGEHEIIGPDGRTRETLQVDGTGEIVRDFLDPPDLARVDVAGVVVDATPGAAERPVVGARLRVVPSGPARSVNPEAVTDAAGRFSFGRRDDGNRLALYSQDRDGALAGFQELAKNPNDVKVALVPAATVSGRIVEGGGWPSSGLLSLLMVDGPGDAHWKMSLGRAGIGDDQDGRFCFKGLIPSASYEAWFVAETGPTQGRRVLMKRITVDRPGPIDLGDLALTTSPARPAPAPELESSGESTRP